MIISLNDLPRIRIEHHNQTIVLAGGVFDLMHPGHIDLLKHMRESGDIVVVAVTSDKRVKQKKGKARPIHDQQTRLTMVEATKYVDYAFIAPEPKQGANVPSISAMKLLKPNVFISSDKSWLKHNDTFNSLSIKLKIIPRYNKYISTSRTIKKILKINSAAEKLN